MVDNEAEESLDRVGCSAYVVCVSHFFLFLCALSVFSLQHEPNCFPDAPAPACTAQQIDSYYDTDTGSDIIATLFLCTPIWIFVTGCSLIWCIIQVGNGRASKHNRNFVIVCGGLILSLVEIVLCMI